MRVRTSVAWGMAAWLALGLGHQAVVAEVPTLLYETQTKTATSITIQSDTALWTPTSGNRFVLQACIISVDAAQDIDLEVSDVDVIAPVHLPSNGTQIIGLGGAPIYVSAKDAVLRFSTSTQATTSITCIGYEERV